MLCVNLVERFSNEAMIIEIGVDTTENGPPKMEKERGRKDFVPASKVCFYLVCTTPRKAR